MICPFCHTDNRAGANFCRHCGRLLQPACPRCRAVASPEANFCDTCGYPLSGRVWAGLIPTGGLGISPLTTPNIEKPHLAPSLAAAPKSWAEPVPDQSFDLERFMPRELLAKLESARRSGVTGERRIVTILFCDIRGSTALAEQFDPEEWTDIVNGAFAHMVRPVYKYEGTVARLTGDGLLAFFGAPIAHEDDPRRAILAGLEIVEGIHAYRDELPVAAHDLDVRIGINTGLVVVGTVGSDLRLEYTAIGDAINLAARMEQTAAPGTVRIADDTFRLIAGQFAVEPLGGIEVKGKSQPVSAYRVISRRSGREVRRFQTAYHTPLINRAREWTSLHESFEGLAQGRGGILFLTGDAGLGKSRLIFEAVERLRPDLCPDAHYFEAAAYAYETGQPYGLILRLLRSALGILPDDSADRIRERIMAATGGDMQRLHVLEALFGLTPEQPDASLTGEAFAGQLFLCLEQFWRERAASGPVILALDDLQWMDMTSADLVGRLFPLVESVGILFLCAVRRDRHSAGWRLKETAERDLPHRLVELALYPLTDTESRQLLGALLGASDLPEMLQELILDKAEGNPLFVEEVVHHLIERGHLSRSEGGVSWAGAGPIETIELPDSLQALLTARIDRLDDDTRRTLQVAAVIGRFFPRSPLAALVDRPEALDRQLLDLQRLELIREVTRVPEPGYSFNHTLTHEATYNTILLKQRRQMHLRVAETIEVLRADNLSIVAPVLAHHFIEGDAPRRALPYLIMAADAALALHATAEAVDFYNRAIPIIIENDETPENITALFVRRGRALELQSKFAEADKTYGELEQRGLARGDKKMELEAIIAQGKLRALVTTLHDPAVARTLMARALPLAHELDDRPAEVRILWNLVNTDRFDLNSLEDAVRHGERAITMARELGLEEELAYLLNDLSDVYGTVGRIKDAWGVLDEAQMRWRALSNEPMLADTLSNTAMWYQLSGRLLAAREAAEEAYAITTRINNIWGQAYSLCMHGIVIFQLGEIGRAVEELMLAVEKAREAHFVGGQVICRSFLATIYSYLQDYVAAERVALPGVDLAREQLPQFAAFCISRLAIARIYQGNLAGAAELLDDPLTSLEKQQFFVENDVQLARAEYALARGDVALAIATADEAARHLAELGYHAWIPEMNDCLARAYLAGGEVHEARRLLAESVKTARAMDMKPGVWRYLARCAALEALDGHPDTAAALYREARDEIDTLLPTIWPDSLRNAFLAHSLVRDVMAQ